MQNDKTVSVYVYQEMISYSDITNNATILISFLYSQNLKIDDHKM